MPKSPRRLRRVAPGEPGIIRIRRGKGFAYRLPDGGYVTDPGTVQRIRELAIPPAWNDVWVCLDGRGHIQAWGVDSAGRRQYVYHPRWKAQRSRAKFDHMVQFAGILPQLRAAVQRDLGGDDLGRRRVLACAVRLLDIGLFRAGGEEYANDHEHYGLATLLKTHVQIDRQGNLTFRFTAKSGKEQVRVIGDPDVLKVLRPLKRRRSGGPELLAYRQGRDWVDVRASHINGYLEEQAGSGFTAKEFRTWHATVFAALQLACANDPQSATARTRAIRQMYRDVAELLGNTPAVARSAYVDPRVVDRFLRGETIRDSLDDLPCEHVTGGPLPSSVERAVVKLF
ncbi:MAG TPA: DNA topoisomerase IB [Actinomycetota bacterium]|nr:DNA topoisomerase IB [Actinomycetota bacterium]